MIVVQTGKLFGVVSLQIEHQKVALQLARKFGNHLFQELRPRNLIEYVCGHLDYGWPKLDSTCPVDPQNGLPQDFRALEFRSIADAWSDAIESLANHHPFCGLLASLFFCRFSQHSGNWKHESVKAFLEAELLRQNQLKEELNKIASTSHFTDPRLLALGINQIEFIHELALALICETSEKNLSPVPSIEGTNQAIYLKKQTNSVYLLSPYPFFRSNFEVCIRRLKFPKLKNEAKLNYSNILPELEQYVDTVQIVR